MTKITLIRPDDWHLHLRDGVMLKAVLPETTRDFGRALIMPNLVPPVVSAKDAAHYKRRILDALPSGTFFEPKMTLYLTESTNADDLTSAYKEGLITALKLYPAGATTNSASGVKNFDLIRPVLEKMAEIGCPLCVHGEVTDPSVDIFDREAVFIERVLDPIRQKTPGLKVVMEHITTKEGVEYVKSVDTGLAATITTPHLIAPTNCPSIRIFNAGKDIQQCSFPTTRLSPNTHGCPLCQRKFNTIKYINFLIPMVKSFGNFVGLQNGRAIHCVKHLLDLNGQLAKQESTQQGWIRKRQIIQKL